MRIFIQLKITRERYLCNIFVLLHLINSIYIHILTRQDIRRKDLEAYEIGERDRERQREREKEIYESGIGSIAVHLSTITRKWELDSKVLQKFNIIRASAGP